MEVALRLYSTTEDGVATVEGNRGRRRITLPAIRVSWSSLLPQGKFSCGIFASAWSNNYDSPCWRRFVYTFLSFDKFQPEVKWTTRFSRHDMSASPCSQPEEKEINECPLAHARAFSLCF
jgi:hypothetical protein